MKIEKRVNREECTVKFSFVVSPNEIKPFSEKAVKRLASKVKLPGFRKGKVPLELAEPFINRTEKIRETLSLLFTEGFRQIIARQDAKDLIGEPQFDYDVRNFDPEHDKFFHFSCTMEKVPEVVLGDYLNFSLEVETIVVSEEACLQEEKQIEAYIRRIDDKQKKNKKDNCKQHTHEGKSDLEKNTTEDIPFETLMRAYTQFKNRDELREYVQKVLRTEKEKKNVQQYTASLLKHLEETSTVFIPKTLITIEENQTLHELETKLKSHYNTTLVKYLEAMKKTKEDFDAEIRKNAEKKAKIKVILDAIAEKEGLQITKEEVENECESILMTHKKKGILTVEGEKIKKILKTTEGLDFIRKNILRDKTIRFLLQKFLPNGYGSFQDNNYVEQKSYPSSVIPEK